ncbi:MAG: hypothetical protein AAF557_02475 [Pseudomonadota bacterium]
MRLKSLLFGLTLALLFTNHATAQNAAGRWSCQDGRQYTGSLRDSSELRSFEMLVQPDGSVQGQGVVQMVNGAAHQYSFNGRWGTSGRGFFWRAASSLGGAEMTFDSVILDGGSMARDWIDPATGTRVSTTCQRIG